jgi:hypothetical protein
MLWACGDLSLKSSFGLFTDRIMHLWVKSGPNFLFLYLKECLRLITRVLAGYPKELSRGIAVKLDKHGLPTILPIPWRTFIMSFIVEDKDDMFRGVPVIVSILSMVSIFRSIPTRPRLKLDSILNPFSGVSPSFTADEVKSVLKSMGVSIRFTRFRSFVNSYSSGPNVRVSC